MDCLKSGVICIREISSSVKSVIFSQSARSLQLYYKKDPFAFDEGIFLFKGVRMYFLSFTGKGRLSIS